MITREQARANLLVVLERVLSAVDPLQEKKERTPDGLNRPAVWIGHDAIARRWESTFEDITKRQFLTQKKNILSILNRAKKSAIKAKSSIDWNWIDDNTMEYLYQNTEDFGKSYVNAITGIVDDQGKRWGAMLGLSFSTQNLQARDWFNNHAIQFAQEINEVTERQVSEILNQAQQDGASIPKIQNQIESLFNMYIDGISPDDPDFEWYTDRTPRHRTEMIARTETIKASNAGSKEIFKEWGVQKKEWLTTLDGRERPEHGEANAQVVPMDEPFIVGGEQLDYPGDPSGSAWNVINCRCTILPITPDDSGSKPMTEDGEIQSGEETRRRLEELAKDDDYNERLSELKSDLDGLEKAWHDADRAVIAEVRRLMQEYADIVGLDDDTKAEYTRLKEIRKEISRLKLDLREKISRLEKEMGDYYLENAIYNRESSRDAFTVNEKSKFAKSDVRKDGIRYGADAFGRMIDPSYFDDLDPYFRTVDFRKAGKGRASYSPGTGTVNMTNANSLSYATETVIHEMGHWLEDIRPNVLESSLKFMERRTAGETAEWLGRGYDQWEKAKKDQFFEPYCGKVYISGGRHYATEIVSMGLERMYKDPLGFARSDPDYFDYIISVMRGDPKP